MFILYALKGEKWTEYAKFKDRRGYAGLVAEAATAKAENAKTEEESRAAAVMRALVLEKKWFSASDGKAVKRALRHFDEVGISNDVWEALGELLEEGADGFALAKEGENVGEYEKAAL